MRMKLKNKDDEEVEMDPEDTKAAKGSKGGDKKKLQISEMDEWMDSDDMSSSEEEGEEKKKREDEDSDNDSKAKQKKAKQQQSKKKRKKKVEDDEAFEVRLKVPEKKNFLNCSSWINFRNRMTEMKRDWKKITFRIRAIGESFHLIFLIIYLQCLRLILNL